MELRNTILNEIRRLAAENGGQPPGSAAFSKVTGIRIHQWRGVHWLTWGEAVREAGFEPNSPPASYSNDYLLEKLAAAARHFNAIPNTIQMKMYRRTDPSFPARQTFDGKFASRSDMLRQLRNWAIAHANYADVAAMFPPELENKAEEEAARTKDGYVYLIKWGEIYKIGRGQDLEKRVKQVRTGLPESGELVHAIRTDDPPGIEAYWHRRFADKRTENGEWFRLNRADIAAIKRRRFQ